MLKGNTKRNAARVCVPVCAGRAAELRADVAWAAELADIIELRFDCLDPAEVENAYAALPTLLTSFTTPFIITFRPAVQGGREIEVSERESFWSRVADVFDQSSTEEWGKHFFDIEFDYDINPDVLERLQRVGKIIRSQHDFSGGHERAEEIYERMTSASPAFMKIALTARDAADCLEVFRLLERTRREGRELIALSMGEAGLLTRVLGPSRGSFLTFGAAAYGLGTAPGQPTAEELRGVYRVGSINEETLITALIGSPVSHSLSPHIHNAAFTSHGLDAVYIPVEVKNLDDFMRRMVIPRTREMRWRLRGLSVTAPHKSRIIEYLDRVEPSAKEIGAVNTVVIEGAELHGYNTDAAAALLTLQSLLEPRGARVAVIGAGGAARAVLWGLRESGARATVFARNIARAAETVSRFGADVAQLEGARFGDFDAVVNATPLGTKGHAEDETPANAEQLHGARAAFDLVYNPAATRFLREAAAADCRIAGGLGMLVAQAAEQHKLWTGLAPPVEAMREAAELRLRKLDGINYHSAFGHQL